ncbi:MAG: chloride channel protein, partial [Sedimentisphaerales bacterium]|nr:chloride channel protein [Sedimentisphaerales bacterium]
MSDDANPSPAGGGKLHTKLVRFLKRFGFREEAFLNVLACLIGALTGLGSVAFTKLIDLAHEFCYGSGGGHGVYGGHKLLLILLPAAGALLVGLITYFFAREAKGHGVPEVMDAIARRDGRIRPRVAVAKAVSSALTIGSGGSAGTEGPIIQIGAAIGSAFGQFFAIAKHNMPVLVGCGAAAGISAIFHAPIAGVLFALEIFLRELNFRTFSPVLMASVISSVVVSALLGGNEAIFPILSYRDYTFQWYELGNYVVLGLLCAAAGVFFVKLLYACEDLFDWLKVHPIVKPVLGAALLGVVGILVMLIIGRVSA